GSSEQRTQLTHIASADSHVLSEDAGRLSDKQRRYAEMARDACTRLNQIVDDLRDVARSERGGMAMSLTPLLLDELAGEVVERFRPAAQAKKVRLRAETEVQRA